MPDGQRGGTASSGPVDLGKAAQVAGDGPAAPTRGDRPADSPAAARYVAASVAPATARAYRADWQRFASWCASRGTDPLRASGEQLASYLAAAADTVAEDRNGETVPAYGAATLARWVTGLNQVHAAAGATPPPGKSEVVRRTLSGIRRQRRTPPNGRRPLSLAELADMVATAREGAESWPEQVHAARDCLVLLVGFFGAFRGAELVALHASDIRLDADGATVMVRSSKTDQEAAGMTKALRRTTSPVVCPLCAWHTWRHITDGHTAAGRAGIIAALAHPPVPDAHGHVCSHTLEPSPTPEAPAIRWLGRHRLPADRAPTADTVRNVVLARARAAGMPPGVLKLLGAHSLRAGLVTTAYAAGASDGEIMRQTGHKSVTQVRAYQRDAPHVGNAIMRIDYT